MNHFYIKENKAFVMPLRLETKCFCSIGWASVLACLNTAIVPYLVKLERVCLAYWLKS